MRPTCATPRYPKTVILETTNLCNLRCRMCHIWGEGVSEKRQTGFIQESTWRSAIDELASWGEDISVALHGAGEVLLHKDFLKILDYAASKRNLSAGFLSNGSLLTDGISEAILDTDIAWIGFSVDGAEEVKYKNYRGADLKKVEAAIEHFLTLRKGDRPRVFLNMVALPDLDTDLFLKKWIDKVDEVKISTYRPVGHRDFLAGKVERLPCYLLDEMLVVAWNGDVVLCCEDIWAEVPIGRFPEKSLLQLWQSPRFDEIRNLHKLGKYSDVRICADCDSWSNKITHTEVRASENLEITACAAQTSYHRISRVVSHNEVI
jgi:pyruvate-formate lyase-activating enzyme